MELPSWTLPDIRVVIPPPLLPPVPESCLLALGFHMSLLLPSLATTCTQILPPPFSPGQIPLSLLFPPCLLMCPPLSPHLMIISVTYSTEDCPWNSLFLPGQLLLFTSPCHLPTLNCTLPQQKLPTTTNQMNSPSVKPSLLSSPSSLPALWVVRHSPSAPSTPCFLISIIALVTLYYLDLFSELSPQSEVLEGNIDILLILVPSVSPAAWHIGATG